MLHIFTMTTPDSDPLPDYATVAAALERCGTAECPAELHGFAVGMSVAGVAEPLTIWQQEVYADFDPADVLASECRILLDRVFASAFADQVAAGEEQPPYALTLLLPQDIVVDASRLVAVRDWCQGFLFGFGLGGEAVAAQLSAQTRELLNDFAEITRLDTDGVENDAENQSALIEIEEYLRTGVMLIRDELVESRAAQTKALPH